MREAVVVSGVRTPVGRAIKGTLKDTRPEDLSALVIKEAVNRADGLKKNEIDDVILGCATPEGAQGMNIARVAALHAGLPDTVPGMTVNRFCSSGLQAIAIGAGAIQSDWMDIIVAGGVECSSSVPMAGIKPSFHPRIAEECPEIYTPMGITAENVQRRYNVSREDMDRFAVDSHEKALKAIKEGKFKDEVVPVKARVFVKKPDGTHAIEYKEFDTDECPRSGSTVEVLGKLRPAFDPTGQVTAGNSSPLNDGAAAVVLMSKEEAEKRGIKPMATLRAFTAAGVAPDEMGIGPVAAVRKLLKRTGVKLEEIDLIELNEAFASQSVYCIRELGFDEAKVNVNGGAIALGHPLGATGAKLTVTLLHEMARRNARYGLVTMCIGGGMGAAGLFERN
jgi:acetyl-CoA acyltransferase